MLRLVSLAALAAIILCPAVWADDVLNGGFETGSFSDWETNGTGATFAVTAGNQQSGTYCAELTGTDGSMVSLCQTIAVSPDRKYKATFYYKTAGSVAALDCHLEQRKDDHSYAGVMNSLGAAAGSTPAWTMKSVTFNTTSDTAEIYWYNAANIGSGVKLFFDSFSLVDLGPASNVLDNGGFETGDYSGWMASGNGVGAAYLVSNGGAGGPYSGSYCLEISGLNGSLTSIEPVPWIAVQPNTAYTASFYWRTDGDHEAFQSNLEEWTPTGYARGYTLVNDGGPKPGWTRASATFTTGPTTNLLRWWNGSNVPSGVKLFLDDFRIRLAPQCDSTPCNGGFETGETDFWSLSGSGADVTASSGGAVGPKSGSYCLEFAGTTGALRHVEQFFTGLVPGVTYEASAYFRTSAPIVAIGITLVEHNPAGDQGYSMITGGAENRPGWSKVAVTFTARAGSTGYTWHNDANVPNGVSLFIDDCRIREAPTCVGVPCNGGFETGETDFWSFGGSGAVFGVTDVAPHSGTYCGQVVGIDGTLVNPNQKVAVNPSTTYTASLYYKTEGSVEAWDSHIDELKADSSYAGRTRSLGTVAGSTPDWTKAQVTFTTTSSTHFLSWYNGMNLANGVRMFLDDFDISEVVYSPYTVGALRQAPLGTPATLDVVVTRAFDNDGEKYFFVESPDRSAAFLVENDAFALTSPPNPGDTLHLRGYTATSGYEDYDLNRVFSGMLVFKTDQMPTAGVPAQVAPLKPLGTILRPLMTGVGATLDGLFVKVGGMVFNADPMNATFEINDGSGMETNIRVAKSYSYFPGDGDLVALTGCVVSTNGVRWIYVTSLDEVQTITP